MSEFNAIADSAIVTLQTTFGDPATWKPGAGGAYPITVIIDTAPDPLGDIGAMIEVVTEMSVRVEELEAAVSGGRIRIGDVITAGSRDWTVDSVLDDDGIEQRVSVK